MNSNPPQSAQAYPASPGYAPPPGGAAPYPGGAGPGTPYPTAPARPRIPVPPNDGTWSLLELQQWDALSKDFSGKLDGINTMCGTRIEAWFVFDTWRGHFTKSPERPIGDSQDPTRDHALAVFDGVGDVCNESNTDIGKAAVSAHVRRIDVRWGGPAAGMSSVYVGNGIVVVTINPWDNVGYTQLRQFIKSEVRRHI